MLVVVLLAVPAFAQAVQSVTYTGNGTGQTILASALLASNVPVHMAFVQCTSGVVLRATDMAASKLLDGTTVASAITAFGIGTIDVGLANQVNGNALTCRAVLFGGANLHAGWGTYTGDGTSMRVISNQVGEYTLVMPGNGAAAVHLLRDHTSAAVMNTGIASTDLSVAPSGFAQVSGLLNTNGVTYFIAAFPDRAQVLTGSYLGDGVDNRFIGLGGRPELVMTQVVGSALWRLDAIFGDATYSLSGGAPQANQIQSIQPLGFQVGTDLAVNGAGRTIDYVAFSSFSTFDGGPLPTDGGSMIDGGAGDAGAADAGEVDAGAADAGSPDAGASDAGAADAGASDASTTAQDAGAMPDAGAGDAGAGDGGTTADGGPGSAGDYGVACGCDAAGAGWLIPLLALMARRRRSTR